MLTKRTLVLTSLYIYSLCYTPISIISQKVKKRLMHRERKEVTHGPTAGKWWSQNLNTILLIQKPVPSHSASVSLCSLFFNF